MTGAQPIRLTLDICCFHLFFRIIGIKAEFCPEVNVDEAPQWSNFPDLIDDRDGHTCTSFYHKTFGLAIMVTQGYSTTSSEVFMVQQCQDCGISCETSCSWQSTLNGSSLVVPGPPKVAAAMTTLNGVPTLFGGSADGQSGEESDHVYQFQVEDADGTPVNEWKPVVPMNDPRQRHTVVSVPLDFICAQELTTTMTRYAILQMYYV